MEETNNNRRKTSHNIGGCLACLDKVTFLGPNPIAVLQLVCYGLSLFFGLLVCIPIGITLRRFNGNCLLYAQVVWDNKQIWPWSESACDFMLYMNLGVNVVYVVLMILFTVMFLTPRIDGDKFKGQPHMDRIGLITKYQSSYVVANLNPVMSLINVIIWATHVSAAIVLTVGFSKFCRSMENSLEVLGTPMTCAQSQSALDWSTYRMVKSQVDEGPNGNGFFTSYLIAVISQWILCLIWLMQMIINFSQTCTRCSCAIAEEKVKIDVSQRIASRRSRMATPSMTPGAGVSAGGGIPVAPPMGAPFQRGPPSVASYPGGGYQPPPQAYPQPPQGGARGPPSTSSLQMGAPPGWGRSSNA